LRRRPLLLMPLAKTVFGIGAQASWVPSTQPGMAL
jgi:hypothetical protein